VRLLGTWDLPGHGGPVYALACNQEQRALFSGGADGIVAEWRCFSGKQARAVAQTPGAIYALHWLPEKKHLYVGESSGTVYALDLAEKKLFRAIKAHESAVFGLASHPEAPEGWSSGRDGKFLYWDVQEARPYAAVPVTPAGLRGFTRAQESFFCAGRDGKLYQIPRGQYQVAKSVVADPQFVFALEASPDGQWIAAGGKSGTLQLWTPDLQPAWEVPAHAYTLSALAWHPNGHLLATGGRDRVIHLWDVTERKKRLTLSGHVRSVNALLWIDSETLASAGDDGLIKVWHLEGLSA